MSYPKNHATTWGKTCLFAQEATILIDVVTVGETNLQF